MPVVTDRPAESMHVESGVLLLRAVPETRLEPFLRIAAHLCDTPMATISANDCTRERFAACHGCDLDWVASAKGFSDYVISGECTLVVGDTRTDTRFRHAPLREKLPGLRFYAGVPIVSTNGALMGTLAVMDETPRHLPAGKLDALRRLGNQLALILELESTTAATRARAGTPRDTGAIGDPHIGNIFNTLPGYHYLVDPQKLKFVAVTDAVQHALSQPREELLKRPMREILLCGRDDSETREGVRQLLGSVRRVAQSGKPDRIVAVPYPVLGDAEGRVPETRYWNVTHAPVHDEPGNVSCVVGHAVDVTEVVRLREREGKAARDRRVLEGQAAKLEQDMLRRSKQIERLNEHLHMAQAMANVGSWELDLRGSDSFWSDEVYEIAGIRLDGKRIPPDPIIDAVHPDDRDLVERCRKAAIASCEQVEVTHRVVHTDGSLHFARQHIRVAVDDDGKPLTLYGTIQDITGQKAVEDELETRARQQEVVAKFGQKALMGERLETLLDEAADLVCETLDVEYCKIMQLQPDGKAMKLVAGKGWKDGLIGHAVVNIGRNSQAGYTLQQKHSVIVTDLRSDKRFDGPPLLRDHGVVSGISVIIDGKRGPWGALGAHTTHLRKFTRDDVNFFESIANIIGEAAWLRTVTTEMSGRTGRMEALLRISRMALTGCSRRKLQSFAAECIAGALDADCVGIAEQVPDGSGMTLVAGKGWRKGLVGGLPLRIDKDSHGGFVLASGKPVMVDDVATETRFKPAPVLVEHEITSCLSIAIKGRKGPVGMLGVHSRRRRKFDADEVEFVRQAAAILEEAQAGAASASS